ncbi:MAG: rod shape-determining protein RodA [Acidimicrobiia bacterium]|nr:rod shape-determining protein RodA [Acidimicrobiia bacterium]
MTSALVRGRGVTASAYENRRPDLLLTGALLLLGVLSVLMIYSASAPRAELLGNDPAGEAQKQAVIVFVGLVAFAAGSVIEHRSLHTAAPVMYAMAVVALAAVLVWGREVNNAVSWFSVFGFQFQPSEWAKPAVIVMLAALLAPAVENKIGWRRVFTALGLMGIPVALIARQPDLGTLLVVVVLSGVMLFAAGASLRQLGLLVGSGGLFTWFAYNQRWLTLVEERIDAWLNPEQNALAVAFQPLQSQIAIGSGGFSGRGLFEGSQTNLAFIPEQTTDFIFTAVGEQLGFIGGALLIATYAVVVWRLLRTAAAAEDRFGMLVAIGVAALLTFHVFVNVGMTLGIMPVTGIPLPFMSAGGSSFTALAFALGMTHSIWLHRSKVPARVSSLG